MKYSPIFNNVVFIQIQFNLRKLTNNILSFEEKYIYSFMQFFHPSAHFHMII